MSWPTGVTMLLGLFALCLPVGWGLDRILCALWLDDLVELIRACVIHTVDPSLVHWAERRCRCQQGIGGGIGGLSSDGRPEDDSQKTKKTMSSRKQARRWRRGILMAKAKKSSTKVPRIL